MDSAALLLPAVLLVAYANGANDNFKGVATLFGAGVAGYRRALAWGTLATLAGSLTALALSGTLVDRFSGRGLVPDAVAGRPGFVGAVALGAALTVLLATLLSLPVSTTHALIGALLGAAWVQAPDDVRLSVLGAAFVLPLIASPLAAMALTVLVYPTLHWARLRSGIKRESCVCVNRVWVPATPGPVPAAAEHLELAACQERYQGTVLSVTAHDALNASHYVSAAAVSFARGLNDTPKITALLVAAEAASLPGGTALVGLAMALGALLQARRVAETMSRGITPVNHGQGFSANVVTAALTIAASAFGLSVSTTHVSCGSLFGIGIVTRQARWRTIGAIVAAWGITLPAAMILAALAALTIS